MGNSFMQNVTGLTGRLLGLRYGRDSLTVMRAASLEVMMILAPILRPRHFRLVLECHPGRARHETLTFHSKSSTPSTDSNIFSISAIPGIIKSFFQVCGRRPPGLLCYKKHSAHHSQTAPWTW